MVQWLFLVAVAHAGACDDTHTGQPMPPAAPPELVRVTVQDVRGLEGAPSPTTGFVQRNTVVDLLDEGTPQSCSDVQPCVGQFTIDLTAPDFACVKNVCNDPLRVPSAGVPLSVPLVPARGDAGSGMQIRVVFDKLLSDAIETVTSDPTQPPGQGLTYTLAPGLIELDDALGKEVASVTLYDNGGSSAFTSDLMLAPFGPALVLKPMAPLLPATTYTLVLPNPQKLVDDQGRPAIGRDGNALPTPYRLAFTTEPLTPDPAASYPDFSTTPTKIAPNQLLQFAFWEPIDEASVQATVAGPGGSVPVLAYADRGGDAKMCAPNPWVLDVVAAAGGAGADWAAGDYTLSLVVKDASGKSTFSTGMLKFTVSGSATAMDPLDWRAHPAPAQCTS